MDEIPRMIALQDRAIERHEAAIVELSTRIGELKTEQAVQNQLLGSIDRAVSRLEAAQKEDERLKAKGAGMWIVIASVATVLGTIGWQVLQKWAGL